MYARIYFQIYNTEIETSNMLSESWGPTDKSKFLSVQYSGKYFSPLNLLQKRCAVMLAHRSLW